MIAARSLYRVELVYGAGSGTVSRNLAFLADDEQDARETAGLRKREYEEVGSVVLVRAAGDADDDTAGSPDHNRRV